jgi:hypothetical protein
MLRRRLLCRAVIPRLRVFVGGKLEDNDVLDCAALEDLGAAVNGPNDCWMFFEAGRRELLRSLKLGCVTGLLSGDHYISWYFAFLNRRRV